MIQFIYPALCDFASSMLLMIGLVDANAYTSIMVTAIALPFTAFCVQWDKLRVRKTLDQMQVIAIVGICSLIARVFVFSPKPEESFDMISLIFIGLSACLQALKSTLENRLFVIDDDLSPLSLQRTICIWKLRLMAGLFLVSNIVLGSLGNATGSNISALVSSLGNLFNNPVSSFLFLFIHLPASFLVTYLGLKMTKQYNALFMQSASLLCLPLTFQCKLNIGVVTLIGSTAFLVQYEFTQKTTIDMTE